MKTRRRVACRAGFVLVVLLAASSLAHAQRPEAVVLKKQGDALLRASPAEAEAIYRRAIALDPAYQDAYAALSIHLLRAERFKDTVTLLEGAVARLPRFAEGWYNLGYALRKSNRLDEAITAYQKSAALRPSSADPHFGLGLALQAKGDARGAAAAFRKYALLETSPAKRTWVEKALKLAVELEGKAAATAAPADRPAKPVAAKPVPARPVAAEPAGKPVVKPPKVAVPVDDDEVLDPYAAGAKPAAAAKRAPVLSTTPTTPERRKAQDLKGEGDRLAQAGKLAEAAEKYKQAVAADFSFVPAFNELGNVLFALQRYTEAVNTFRVAIRDNPDYHLGWYNLAYALRKANRLAEAVVAYRKFIVLEPKDPDPHYGLALAYQALGQKTEALRSFKDYVQKEKRPPQERWVHRALVEIAKLEGKPAPAPFTPGTLITDTSAQADAAPASRPLTKAERAREARRRAAEERKAREEARRAALAEKKRQQEEARAKATEEKKAKEEARRAALAEKKRQKEEARAKAAEEKKAQEEARRAALEAKKLGKKPAAVAAVEAPAPAPRGGSFEPPKGVAPAADTIESPPLPPPPGQLPASASGRLRVQADTLARAGKCTDAGPLYKRALELDPFDLLAFDGMAHCAFRMGAYTQGASLISLALRDNPDYDRGWLHLARLDRAAGRRERAVGSYRKFIAKQTGELAAQLELARTLKSLGLKGEAIPAYQEYLRRERNPGSEAYRLAAYLELKSLGGAPPAGAEPAPSATPAKASPRPSPDAGKGQSLVEKVAEAAREGGTGVVENSAEKPKSKAELRAEQRRRALEERKAQEAARREALAEKQRQREAARQKTAEERKAKAEAARAAAEEKRKERKAAEQRRRELARMARLAREDQREEKRPGRRGKRASGGAEELAEAVGRDVGEASPPPEPPSSHDLLKAAPEAARGLVSVADAQFAKQRYDVALGIYQQAIKLDPSATEPIYKAGVAAVALGQMHLAADLFEAVLQLDPGNATAATNLKMAKAAARAARPSTKYLETAAAQVQANLDAGRNALALRQADKLLALQVSATGYLMRSQARLALQQSQAALQDAGRALALDPSLLEAFRAMAEAHRQLGAGEKAVYYLRLYLARGSGSLSDAKRAEAERALKELGQP